MPLGVPVVPLVHRKIPPHGQRRGRRRSGGRGRLAGQPKHGESRLEVVPDQRQRLRHLQHPQAVSNTG